MEQSSTLILPTSSILDQIEHSENELFVVSKTKLDLEYSNPTSKRYCVVRIPDKKKSRKIISGIRFAFLQEAYLLSVGQGHCRSDLASKQSRLRNNFIFGMLYCSHTVTKWSISFIIYG